MSEHGFSFVVSGVDTSNDDFVDRFHAAGCDDATLVLQKGHLIVSFDRAAEDFVQAVESAYADVLRTGARIERFEPDHLVSQSEIARRAHLSRAAISLYVGGQRGNNFPPPCARVTSESPLWDWVEVADWLSDNDQLDRSQVVEARVARAVNDAVRSGRRPDLSDERRLIEELAHKAPLAAHRA